MWTRLKQLQTAVIWALFGQWWLKQTSSSGRIAHALYSPQNLEDGLASVLLWFYRLLT
jgi:hypothetical protein